MPVVDRARVNRAQQVQLPHDVRRLERKDFLHGRGDFFVGDRSRAERVDEDARRLRLSDRVGDLQFAALRQARRDDVFRRPAAKVGAGAVDFRRVFPGKRAAAVPPGAAVGVDDDFPPREPRVAVGPADDEFPRRVDEKLRPLGEIRGGNDGADQRLAERGDFVAGNAFRVLRGKHDVFDAGGNAVFVAHGDLRLAVGAQPARFRRGGIFAHGFERAQNAVREHHGRGHQLRRLVRRVAEHDALVARALLGGAFPAGGSGVDALRDVGRLAADEIRDFERFGVEDGIDARVRVADFAHGVAHERVEIERRLRRDFPGEHDVPVLDERFARDAGTRILREARVEHAVGDVVRDFVRMSGADGFGRKNEGFHCRVF